MYVVVVQKFTFAISSPDEFLFISAVHNYYNSVNQHVFRQQKSSFGRRKTSFVPKDGTSFAGERRLSPSFGHLHGPALPTDCSVDVIVITVVLNKWRCCGRVVRFVDWRWVFVVLRLIFMQCKVVGVALLAGVSRQRQARVWESEHHAACASECRLRLVLR